jgi:hypothetical protein
LQTCDVSAGSCCGDPVSLKFPQAEDTAWMLCGSAEKVFF